MSQSSENPAPRTTRRKPTPEPIDQLIDAYAALIGAARAYLRQNGPDGLYAEEAALFLNSCLPVGNQLARRLIAE